jgi:hypothetical protein
MAIIHLETGCVLERITRFTGRYVIVNLGCPLHAHPHQRLLPGSESSQDGDA